MRNLGGTPYGRSEKKGDDITQVLRSQATLRPAYYKVQPATRVIASLANRSRMFHVEQRINASTTKRITE